ncbi:hypothetical protein QWZ08_01960 [Ferruginibacter paludis]|uniref:rolling circle replication-associated protein n=1 Tax=Ferruginibacter paludis TaxID=1310417 RepID=UPI0025B32F6E|nr:hypothetical protein [Ferruginibacter paludis]MDN3654371.1 hypothetical protein [Ferruginibacter paludis]
MRVVKNTYGVSIVFSPKQSDFDKMGSLSGSCLNRVKAPPKIATAKKQPSVNGILKTEKSSMRKTKELELKKSWTMSPRTKSKIRRKIIALSQVQKRLSFVTLTFCNNVDDAVAVKILAKFLDNVKKLSDDFQYLWVAEKQTNNVVFKDNIHFHLITNKFWEIKKWWPYWLDLQARNNILPTDENYRPSSAFDVKKINSKSIKSVCNYLTKYVTKNVSKFNCQVWNCSKKISRLYTDFYSGTGFIDNLEYLEEQQLLGGEIKTFIQEYCDVKLIPLNRTTLPFYSKIEKENRRIWNYKPLEKLNEPTHEKATV